MATKLVELAAAGASEVITLPMQTQNWNVPNGFSVMVNFSGNVPGDVPAVASVSVQLSNDSRVKSLVPSEVALARWNDMNCMEDLTEDSNNTLAAPVAFMRLWCSEYTSGRVQLSVGFAGEAV